MAANKRSRQKPRRFIDGYIRRMRQLDRQQYGKNPDPDMGHRAADALLVECLNNLGFGDLTAEYEKIEKWYS